MTQQATHQTATEEINQDAFPQGDWHYDGHGISLDGQQLITLADTTVDEDRNRDRRGKQLAEFCNEAHRLQVDSGNRRVFITLDQNELESFPRQLVVVEVKRPDGKTARFHLSLSGQDNRCKAELYAQGQSEALDSRVTRTGRYVNYDSDPD